MIRGKYSLDSENMAVIAEAFAGDDAPGAGGRLTLRDDRFVIEGLWVEEAQRGQGLGDLIMRMLLFRAVESEASGVYVLGNAAQAPFFARYGLRPTEDEGVYYATRDALDLEGDCKKDRCKDCAGDCGECRA